MAYTKLGYDDYGMLCDEFECPECHKAENKIEGIEEEFRMLAKLLYSKEAINPHTLDNIMCEIESYLGKRDIVPNHLPTVQPVGTMPEVLYQINKDLL